MAQPTTQNRIYASLTALLLVFMLISSVVLACHHHHHEDHHDEAHCTVCQLIETTITTLGNTLSAPPSGWVIFMIYVPFLLTGAVISTAITPETLVRQNVRNDN